MSLHPLTLGVMLVVAAGTLIYHFWNQNQNQQYQHQQEYEEYQRQRDRYRSQNRAYDDTDFNNKTAESLTINESAAKIRSNKRKKKSDLCTICLAELSYELHILTCQHIFHKNCITQWLKRNNTCPICRRQTEPVI